MILNNSQPPNRILFWFYVSPVGLKVQICLGGIPVGAQSAQWSPIHACVAIWASQLHLNLTICYKSNLVIVSYHFHPFKMQTACSTVMKQPPEYSKAWSFRTMLTMPPIPHGNQHSVDITTQIFRTQILPARPDRITHIEARYKSAESSGAVLSLEGYIQHSSGINRYQLDRWFHAS
jgi:hypothetical protein